MLNDEPNRPAGTLSDVVILKNDKIADLAAVACSIELAVEGISAFPMLKDKNYSRLFRTNYACKPGKRTKSRFSRAI